MNKPNLFQYSGGIIVLKFQVSRNRSRMALAGLAAFSALAMSVPDVAIAAERASYVLFSPGSESVTMSGSSEDVRRARALRSGNEPLLYVRRGSAAYVIRDAATLRQAKAIFEPQEALGARQAELGSRQAALGERQARLGAEQARLGSRQADATPRQAAELARQQSEFGRRQGELGRLQATLGEQQSRLGEEQNRLSRIAGDKLQALLADALRRGVARRAN
jgi:hypothetical protein